MDSVSIKVAAKTVDDALTEASIQLGTSKDNIEYTVLDEGSKGFFGIGGRKAVIEAKKKVTDEDLMKEIFEEKPEKPKKEFKKETRKEPKKEYRKESRQEKKEGKEPKKESKKEPKKESVKDTGKESIKESTKESGKDSVKDYSAKDTGKDSVKDTGKVSGREKEISGESKQEAKREFKKENKRDFRKESDRNRKEVKGVNESAAAAAELEKEEAAEREPRIPADPEVAKKRATDFLLEIFSKMNMDVEVKAEFEDGTLCVDIVGEDMGIMIGKRGQTLDSLQYLTSLVVNKEKTSYVRVKVDTEDYRNRRKATLENLARNIALKVKKTRKPVFLEPMNPYERRIIHSALQNDPYVTTHSEGEEPYRKVVVTPKRDRDRGHGYSKYNNRRNHYDRENRTIETAQDDFAADAVQTAQAEQTEE